MPTAPRSERKAGMACRKLSEPGGPGCTPGLGGISVRPWPRSINAASTRAMISVIGSASDSTSARDR